MRIFIADGRKSVRHALAVLLAAQQDLHIAGEASCGEELLSQATAIDADIALVDWELPGLAELGGFAALRKRYPALPIVALSGRPDVRRAAQTAGVTAFVSKGDPPERLLAAIRQCTEPANWEV